MANDDRNVLGGMLENCSMSPRTGFYRDGCCNTGPEDLGLHVVCTQVTRDFLAFARRQGNDLVTPAPEFGFPGVKPGDRWCVCAATGRQAYEAGVASPVVLAATHEETLAALGDEAMMRQHFGPFGKLAEKDLDAALESARDHGIELPGTTYARGVIDAVYMKKPY